MVKDVTPTPISDEQQSLQALKQYGGYIISAMIVALAGYFGWNYYQNHGGRIDQQAVNDFANIQTSQDNLATLQEQATANPNIQKQYATAQASFNKDLDSYIAKHGDSVYTWQALMLKAKQQMDTNDAKSAVATLQKASTLKIGDAGLEAIATLRYAQALLADNQANNAQKALQATLPPAFEPSKEELLGDIALHKNDKKSASEHYQKAWQAIEARNQVNTVQQDRALLRLKMQNLGLNPKQPDLNNHVISQVAQPAQSIEPSPSNASVESVQPPSENAHHASQPSQASVATTTLAKSTHSATSDKDKKSKSSSH